MVTDVQTPLKVGFVPEHFSTPIHFAAQKGYFSNVRIIVQLVPFLSGTGHMITALEAREIDVAIGLTEGWIAGLGQGKDWFRIVGGYVETPLCWAISTGSPSIRPACVPRITSIPDLRGRKLGISRYGSGSYVMGFVLADQQGWLEDGKNRPFDFQVLDHFRNLRDAVNDGTADAFMWEYFTSKKFYDKGEIHQIGEIFTPWPSWHIVSHISLLPSTLNTPSSETTLAPDDRLPRFLTAIDQGIKYFNEFTNEAVSFIANSKTMEYSEEDARAWVKAVKFVENTRNVKHKVVKECADILKKAGVVKEGNGVEAEHMVVAIN